LPHKGFCPSTASIEAAAHAEAHHAKVGAKATGLGRGTVSTTLTRLAKGGEVAKAERGYRLPASGTPAVPEGDPTEA
jgi:hypothetical protein